MITALSLTILIYCGEPTYVIAEVGRVTREYAVESMDWDRKQINLKNPDDPHIKFLQGVEREIRIRNLPIQFRARQGECS